MPEPHLLKLGRFVAALSYDAIPESTRRAARFQVLDMIAAAHASARSPETASILPGLAGFAGAGRASVLGSGGRLAPADAALANAAFSMAQDFDDIIWMGHTCHSAVFASLAVAEHEGADARAFLTAVVAANEVGGRIGASCFLGPLNGQMWTFIHLVGAAAGAAKILDLDAERTTHALAIALAQPNFALQPGFMRPTSKLLSASTPTAAGIQAAYFARAGMTGEPTILEDRRGFWRRFSFIPLPGMLGGLGEFWALETLTVKTYPGCHFFQTACAAIEEIAGRRGRPLAAAGVRAVRIETTKLACEVTRFAGDYAAVGATIAPVNVNFDLGVTAAILLHAGRLTPAEMEPAWLAEHSLALRRWRGKVTVEHDPLLTARVVASARAVGEGRAALASLRVRDLPRLLRRYEEEYESRLFTARDALGLFRLLRGMLRRKPAAAAAVEPSARAVPLYFPARVTIDFEDGARERAEVELPPGSFAAPGAERELAAKLAATAGPVLGEARAREAFEAGLALGEGASLGDFVRMVQFPGRLEGSA